MSAYMTPRDVERIRQIREAALTCRVLAAALNPPAREPSTTAASPGKARRRKVARRKRKRP